MSTNKMREALEVLLRRDEANTCQHDETYRGGVIWEICRQCGAKWADDKGGKPEWVDPPEWLAAREAIADDDAVRGAMQEEFEAWWTREGATMCIGSSQSIARAAWQASRAAAPQSVEPVAWREHVEQRLMTWRQSFVSKSGDQLALDDFMDKESLDDLIDFVCDEYAHLSTRPAQAEEWMPIETAPTGKVHSPLLHAIVASLLDDGSYSVEEAWFDDERREWWPANVEYTDAHGSAIYPTHWRPLPAPPTKTKEPGA